LLIELSGLAGVKTKLHKPFYRPVDIAVQKGDCSKLILETGWKASIPIGKTLKDLLDYWVCKLRKENR
jgi:nucleoside-diphosphate-sugar epimerase